MTWTTEPTAGAAMTEQAFELEVEGRTVPGVYWAPVAGVADRLVLLGHGGSTHKRVDYLMEVAAGLAGVGVAGLAIDGPGHGDRAPTDGTAYSGGNLDDFARAWNAGGGTDGIVADWIAALDFIEAELGPRPTGWWGLSMGTMMGLPVVAAEPRIQLAVLGLMGNWGPNGDDLVRLAPEVTCPLRFLVQWDDEVVPRDACLELFGLLGSNRRSLHANPGAHAEVPRFEVASSVNYLAERLSP